MTLANKKIVVIVSGGIAAYKAADLVSRLRKGEAQVRVVMTAAARQFVTPLTFESLAGYPVYEEVFERPTSWEMEHISWARWADAVVVAPATANLLAKMAQGLADDAASTLLLAFEGPVWVAPAMNTAMWNHAATQANLRTLKERGIQMFAPEAGRLACGEVGAGRMAEPAAIIETLAEGLETGAGKRSEAEIPATPVERMTTGMTQPERHVRQDLAGRTVMITAGPTREALDPIRFLSNRSTGMMGVELAAEAARRGAKVLLVHGPLAVPVPAGVQPLPAESARQMLAMVQKIWDMVDIGIFAAAVANYETADKEAKKIKGGETLTLQLQRTPDIAAWAGHHRVTERPDKPEQLLVCFAAESEDLLVAARKKLNEKKMDLVCANPIGQPGIGFAAEENQIIMLDREGRQHESPRAVKSAIAAWIWDQIIASRKHHQG